MELIKQHESYLIQGNLDNDWGVNGYITVEANESFSMNISIFIEDKLIGDFNYSKPVEGNISMLYTIPEEHRMEIVSYANTIVDFVLEQFKK